MKRNIWWLGAARIIERDELSGEARPLIRKNGPPLSTLWAVTHWQPPSPKHVMAAVRLAVGARAGSAGLGHAVYFARRYLAWH